MPAITAEQMAAVDRAMVDDHGIALVQMMENAGRALAHLSRVRFLGGDPRGRRVAVLTGAGGNGGGALVCARRLHGWSARVPVVSAVADHAVGGVSRHQLAVARRLGIPTHTAPAAAEAQTAGDAASDWSPNLIIDGLIGYSLRGAPRDAFGGLIRWANDQPAPTLALDVPSGLDATTGTAHDPAIRAAATLTLALPKTGLRAPAAATHVGELYLADISVPPGLYARPGLELAVGPLFAAHDILRLP